jgi:hypothetical protein
MILNKSGVSMAQARRDKSVHDEELVVLHRIEKEISGKFVALLQDFIVILGADLFDQIGQIAGLIREK